MHARLIEELSLNAWPAERLLSYDGWLLRLNRGYTRRANSVWPFGPSTLPLEEKIAYCQDVFAGQGLPCIFKVSPASDPLPPLLAERGYRSEGETLLQTMALTRVLPVPGELQITSEFSERWLQAYFRLTHADQRHFPTAVCQMKLLALPAAFVSIEEGGEIVATGLGVAERGWLGLFEIAVAEELRNRGLGSRITAGLLTWGYGQGARRAYLQVLVENAPARRIYERLGFREAYRYAYWGPLLT